ncbi:dephospho-CoA kinase [Mycoplasmopsis agalactiae]|uniref:dephospho-CoA kinase n=1 Tax=Mycoplasmopsis agalactiae TaxID=2110 RepID=UPI001F198007|nr:dephospho-CoA kinase [Mycoplasmopsis agalactiae]MCE6061953.1 dephospho-CoA kinase [Mycoplasmopsis agalactiae]
MIAIIGKIGVGKTTFSKKLIERGFSVFNCDEFVQKSYQKGNEGYEAIKNQIGDFLCDENGVSKDKIKSWFSQNPYNIDLLEKAIFPIVDKAIKIGKFDFVEIPKLIGKNYDFSKLFDIILCLETPEKNRGKNMIKRGVDNFTKMAISEKNAPKLMKNAIFGQIPIVNIFANNLCDDALFELILTILFANS